MGGDFHCQLGAAHWLGMSGDLVVDPCCNCNFTFACRKPRQTSTPYIRKANTSCRPEAPFSELCAVQLRVPLNFPGNKQTPSSPQHALLFWFQSGSVPASCTPAGCAGVYQTCGGATGAGAVLDDDFGETSLHLDSYNCMTAATASADYALIAFNDCHGSGSCRKEVRVEGMHVGGFPLMAALGCPIPPPSDCTTDGNACRDCVPAGSVCFKTVDGTTSCKFDQAGAHLRYLAGGAGGSNLPGSAQWLPAMGLYWSHDYAQRIVIDNVTEGTNHVWLITEGGSFREFRNPGPGTGLYDVTLTSPSDEYRRLYYEAATPGWRLDYLDGRVDHFDANGLWLRTSLAGDATSKTATYTNGRLTRVSFPDGRREDFAYYDSGPSVDKLESITEVGVGVTDCATAPESCRTWTYLWSDDELTMIGRPDGTAWELTYDSSRNGGRLGYLTQVRLISGPHGRIEAAFEYTPQGKVHRSWRGDPSFTGPNAVDKHEMAYNNPLVPTQTVITDWISPTTTVASTYTLERDPRSIKPRVKSISGACPTCGLAPNTRFVYGDVANPLRETRMTNGRDFHTDFQYNEFGRVVTRTEAVGTEKQRVTTYEYTHATFNALLTGVQVPSTSSGFRRTEMQYDGTSGVLQTRTIKGTEANGPPTFSTTGLATTFTYNTAGQVETIDPPGHGTADVASLTYVEANVPGRNGHLPDSRIDPLSGATQFRYDALNRRRSVTDPNGVETVTSFDALGRVTEVRQKGAAANGSEDLVTRSFYDCPGGPPATEPPADDPPACRSFRDLRCVQLPRGNAIEYRYDAMGRLTAVTRKANCDPATQPLERTLYTLDIAGNRTLERHQRWDAVAMTWITDSATESVYSSRCHVDKTVHGKGGAIESVTEYCYDENQSLKGVWDANHPKGSNPNPTTSYEYDELDRLTRVHVGPGTASPATTKYTYDVQDHLETVEDAEANVTTYTTSDRDLLTREASPVFSGSTPWVDHEYNEHGERIETTDPRGIVTVRTVDAADRVTQETFGPPGSPDPALTTTYSYGSTPAQFNVGRLTGITRDGHTVSYGYDRFGRLEQDGELAYGYDGNGNRTRITYPDSLEAIYTHDFADRELTLSYDAGGGPQPLVENAAYRASGPLSLLELHNGVSETRDFDSRYFPLGIEAGTLDWGYTVDDVGNPTAITGTIGTVGYSTSFDYHPTQYFLQQGNGPWGTRSWTYDRIGNRLTAARGGEPTGIYGYAGSGHLPKLQSVTPAPGFGAGSWTYAYDEAGNQTSVAESDEEGPTQTTLYGMDANGRMSSLSTSAPAGPASTAFRYDGRGFLREAELTVSGAPSAALTVSPVYTSQGLLLTRGELRALNTTDNELDGVIEVSLETTDLLYFAGRPVAQRTVESFSGTELLYITTDHLGTPVLVTDETGQVVWAGGVEPFGETWTAGADNPDVEEAVGGLEATTAAALGRIGSERVFLRYPGQWVSDAFRVSGRQGDLFYNVHRWYQPATGRYSQPDPLLSLRLSATSKLSTSVDLGVVEPFVNTYGYVDNRPTTESDPLGLGRTINCGGGCWVRIERDPHKPHFGGLHANWGCRGGMRGCVYPDGSLCEASKYPNPPPPRVWECIRSADKRFGNKPSAFECLRIIVNLCRVCPACCLQPIFDGAPLP